MSGQPEPVEEVRRRLRLSRLVSGLTPAQAMIRAAAADEPVDVVVMLSNCDPATTDRIRALLADLSVRIVEGHWERF